LRVASPRQASDERATASLCAVDLEEKYAVALGVLSILLLIGGTLLGLWLRHAPARVVRTVFPIAAIATLASFAVFVFIARLHVKG
jgi:hypothetical protein